MVKKKLEVVELNKKDSKIVLSEKHSSLIIFLRKHRLHILSILLLLSLLLIITGAYLFAKEIYQSEEPNIKEVTLDSSLDEFSQYINGNIPPMTLETAKNSFLNSGDFKASGEVLLVKTVESGSYIIMFYSDKTALKIMKSNNSITRINPLENGEYGIDSQGVTNSKAITRDVTIVKTEDYPYGTITYLSDGSAFITNSKMDMFVRNSADINSEYISTNKVTYLKESKNIGNIKLNYYYDGTIEVIKNNTSYLVRNADDLNITDNDVTFKNNNQATIYQTKTTSEGLVINYYTDGGAIILDGTKTLSIRKSNSIIIKDNDVYEIVDNIYVEISKSLDNGNIIYYTNGGAVVNYDNKTYYIDENSNILYHDNTISNIKGDKEELANKSNVANETVLNFEKTAVITTDTYIAIVPKDNILYDTDGKIKDINSTDIDSNDNSFSITNNSSNEVKYRLVIEESPKTDLDVEYIYYQLQIKGIYYEAKKLNSNIWSQDNIYDSLTIKGTNYILIEDSIEPYDTIDIRLMLWTDYDTIPNSMQNKYFYGTIRVYAWIEE